MSSRSRLAVAAALAVALPTMLSSREQKLAYVDYQRVLLEVQDGKAAKARLQKWLDGRQQEIDKEQEALRKEKEQLDRQSAGLPEEQRSERANELQKRVLELTQKWDKSRTEATERERQEMEPIVGKLDAVIHQLAERDELDLVFEKRDSGLVYAKAEHDLTDEAIRSYDAR